jgi:hypothetical protein
MAVVWPPYEGTTGIASVNGDAGPDVTLSPADIGAASQSDLNALDARVTALENPGA